jgi:hypothetical protein
MLKTKEDSLASAPITSALYLYPPWTSRRITLVVD